MMVMAIVGIVGAVTVKGSFVTGEGAEYRPVQGTALLGDAVQIQAEELWRVGLEVETDAPLLGIIIESGDVQLPSSAPFHLGGQALLLETVSN